MGSTTVCCQCNNPPSPAASQESFSLLPRPCAHQRSAGSSALRHHLERQSNSSAPQSQRPCTHGRYSPHLGETHVTSAQMSSPNWSPEQAWLEGCRAHGVQSLPPGAPSCGLSHPHRPGQPAPPLPPGPRVPLPPPGRDGRFSLSGTRHVRLRALPRTSVSN